MTLNMTYEGEDDLQSSKQYQKQISHTNSG